MNLSTKQIHGHIESKLTVIKGERVRGGTNSEFGINIHTVLYVK